MNGFFCVVSQMIAGAAVACACVRAVFRLDPPVHFEREGTDRKLAGYTNHSLWDVLA